MLPRLAHRLIEFFMLHGQLHRGLVFANARPQELPLRDAVFASTRTLLDSRQLTLIARRNYLSLSLTRFIF